MVFATAAAFTGMMVAWGCVVWGTGYYYPPYVGYGGVYPIYYPHYPTYGFGASYNPWTGAYTRGAWRTVRTAAPASAQRYNPRTGTYSRGAVAYGPYGARGAAQAYNPRTGASGATRQGSNVYGSWGPTGVQRGDHWATTSRVHQQRHRHDDAHDADQRGRRGRQPHAAPAAVRPSRRTGSGDVYAGHDGNVYRKQGDSWQKYGTAAGTTSSSRRRSSASRRRTGRRRRRQAALATASGWDSATAEPGESRFGGARRGHAAHARRGQRAAAARRRAPAATAPSGGGSRGGGRRR